MIELGTAFMIGFAGSWHCIGMCGPIALALPYPEQSKASVIGRVLLYNFGRILTYSLIGLLIGALGQALWIAGIQQYIAIGLGLLLLVVALFSINLEYHITRLPFIFSLNTFVKKQLAYWLRRNEWYTFFGIGLLNGLLPCGLVYLAIAGVLNSATIFTASLFMIFFGLGTLPMMLIAAFGSQWISLKGRRIVMKVLPLFLFLFAVLFLARGFGFEAPHEIRFWENWQQIPMCH